MSDPEADIVYPGGACVHAAYIAFPLVEAKRCQDCGAIIAEPDDDPAYECGGCGSIFRRSASDTGTHQCSCGTMAAKLGSQSCPECEEGFEFEDVWAVQMDDVLCDVEDVSLVGS